MATLDGALGRFVFAGLPNKIKVLCVDRSTHLRVLYHWLSIKQSATSRFTTKWEQFEMHVLRVVDRRLHEATKVENITDTSTLMKLERDTFVIALNAYGQVIGMDTSHLARLYKLDGEPVPFSDSEASDGSLSSLKWSPMTASRWPGRDSRPESVSSQDTEPETAEQVAKERVDAFLRQNASSQAAALAGPTQSSDAPAMLPPTTAAAAQQSTWSPRPSDIPAQSLAPAESRLPKRGWPSSPVSPQAAKAPSPSRGKSMSSSDSDDSSEGDNEPAKRGRDSAAVAGATASSPREPSLRAAPAGAVPSSGDVAKSASSPAGAPSAVQPAMRNTLPAAAEAASAPAAVVTRPNLVPVFPSLSCGTSSSSSASDTRAGISSNASAPAAAAAEAIATAEAFNAATAERQQVAAQIQGLLASERRAVERAHLAESRLLQEQGRRMAAEARAEALAANLSTSAQKAAVQEAQAENAAKMLQEAHSKLVWYSSGYERAKATFAIVQASLKRFEQDDLSKRGKS